MDAVRLLLSPPVLACFLFFLGLAITLIAFNTFAVTLFSETFGFSLVAANGLLSAFLVGYIIGIMPGGVLADKTARHGVITATAFTAAGLLMFLIGWLPLPMLGIGAVLAAAGFLIGGMIPLRDMIVRRSAPEGATGRVFGFVYSALDAGGALAPPLFGWLLAWGGPSWLFAGIALALIVGGVSALFAGNGSRVAPAVA
jgi:MFS family permease